MQATSGSPWSQSRRAAGACATNGCEHNAVESYRLSADGTIETTFTFRAGSFDGQPKRYTPRGFVLDPPSNAIWGMQFVWPIKADYRIANLAPDYSQPVIAREKRDQLWIMARTPQIPCAAAVVNLRTSLSGRAD